MRTPRERLYGPPYADIPPNDPRPWRKEIEFGAESEMRRISMPPAPASASNRAADVPAGLSSPLLVAGGVGALATILVWDGLRLAGHFSDHSYDGSVWDAQGNVILVKKNGVIVWTKDMPGPPPTGVPRKV